MVPNAASSANGIAHQPIWTKRCKHPRERSVCHILSQSLGYKYEVNGSGQVVRRKQRGDVSKGARNYWGTHLEVAGTVASSSGTSESAIHYAAQLSLLDGFVEGTCTFMHKCYRK